MMQFWASKVNWIFFDVVLMVISKNGYSKVVSDFSCNKNSKSYRQNSTICFCQEINENRKNHCLFIDFLDRKIFFILLGNFCISNSMKNLKPFLNSHFSWKSFNVKKFIEDAIDVSRKFQNFDTKLYLGSSEQLSLTCCKKIYWKPELFEKSGQHTYSGRHFWFQWITLLMFDNFFFSKGRYEFSNINHSVH